VRFTYIGLGSNLGDRMGLLRAGIRLLRRSGTLLDSSSVYETEAWGLADQPRFLNAVVLLATQLGPVSLLGALKRAEAPFARSSQRWGPRELDLDILLYGGVRVKLPFLEIPHPRMAERGFVMAPLCELLGRGWPSLGHPAKCNEIPGPPARFLAGKEAIL